MLIPRDSYTMRLAYHDADQPNAYGEIVEKIFGVFSPQLGEDSRVCTRLKTWTIVAKRKTQSSEDVRENTEVLTKADGPAVPWSSVNNSTVEENLKREPGVEGRIIEHMGTHFDQLTHKERRGLLHRLKI